ncbi:MAG: NADH-quinone oxidoreductase subunit J, partial [Actinobacteria bacterium]|nr:NADH-quinone oxidoreductase subunit J [Actinomycetota bacterium]
MIAAAIRMVTTKNVVHAALWLVVVLGGVGVNYLLLQAEFVAITQFLVYLGAIIVLFLFGIMLTRAPLGVSEDLDNNQKWMGLGTALLLLV